MRPNLTPRRAAERRLRPGAFIILLSALTLLYPGLPPAVLANTRTGPIQSALNWLVSHQLSDGSYGSLTELQTAPAANALWIGYRDSSNVLLAYNWLKNQMNNSTTWFWTSSIGEADIPGEILYSFAISQHLGILDLSGVTTRLLRFQQSNGGFKGYQDLATGQRLTSSVDTAMALWGLINAKTIPATNRAAALNYLLSLQNPNGSFNLTRTLASNELYSLGPEPISITALATLVLKDASYTTNDSHVSSALSYLSQAVTSSFNGHVYAAALSALVFTLYGRSSDANTAVDFLLSHQNPDGGFRDPIRSSISSNALDTGWAAVALQLGGLVGDIDQNGIVDLDDVLLAAVSWGSTPGAPNWNPRSDVDGNGVVNLDDVLTVAVNWGKTAESL